MYSISSLTSGQQTSSSKAIGGLATGLDSAELIKNMTVGTRSKIAKQQQSKQLLTWQTEAYRTISSKLVDFSRKYTSFTSSSNLLSSKFYTSSNITTSGSNASKVTVSGTSSMADQLSIVSATKASAGGALSTEQLKLASGSNATAETKISDIIPAFAGGNLNIGGTDIALAADSTIADAVTAINAQTNAQTNPTGITARYVESLGVFEFTTTKNTAVTITGTGTLATDLLGGDTTVAAKTDAEIIIKYGDGAEIPLTNATGSFNVDGLTINVNDTFAAGDPVKLKVSADTDKVLSTIKDMVKDYNDIVDLVNTQYTEKPNRNFPPLTDEQRKELTEDEAKKWDEKAKAGMLFGNTDIGALSRDLRTVFFSDKDALVELEKIGITASKAWQDNGKIVIDEEKLKKAITEDPENVTNVFSRAKSDTESGGVMVRLKSVTDKYAKTEGATKGILVEKAGSLYAPLSLTKNTLLEQSKRIDTIIANLNRTLLTEESRYQKQFANLETVYAKMNAQAGWLNQQFGG